MKYNLTVHDIPGEGMPGLLQLLDEEEIKYTVELVTNEAQGYLDECKGLARYISVANVTASLLDHPKNAKALLGWNGSMAQKFLKLAGAWDDLDEHKRNVILGYEVARDDRVPNDPGGGY